MSATVLRFAGDGDPQWTGINKGSCCMHDTEPFDGPVYSYPLRRELGIWYVRGIFCSLECTKRYVLDHFPLGSNIINLFALMCHLVYLQKKQIQPASSQCVLQKFCISGGWTIAEFRRSFIETIQPPIYPFLVDLVEYASEKALPLSMKIGLAQQPLLATTKTTTTNTLDDYLKLDSDSVVTSDDELPDEVDEVDEVDMGSDDGF